MVKIIGTKHDDVLASGMDGVEIYGDPGKIVEGEPSLILNKGHGGDDEITGTGNNQTLYGDVFTMSGKAKGGCDEIWADLSLTVNGIPVTQTLYGDAYEMLNKAKGGDDIIRDFESEKDTLSFENVDNLPGSKFDDLDAITTITDTGDDVLVEVGLGSIVIEDAGTLGDGDISDLGELNTLIDIQVNGTEI